MKTVYPPSDGKPRTLTHDEVVRVDAFSMGPADFHEQRHARYDQGRLRKLLEPELSEEKPHRLDAQLELDRRLYEYLVHRCFLSRLLEKRRR